MLKGKWLYAGNVFDFFGHDLLEFTARLWPLLRERFDGVVCHRFSGLKPLTLKTSGKILSVFGPHSVTLAEPDPVRVERLVVPEILLKVNHYALGSFVESLDHLASAGLPSSTASRVFLSRSRLPGPPRSPFEGMIEQMAAREGFQSIHPEELSLEDQIGIMQRADTVAGIDGSAMHLVALCRPSAAVINFDTRRVRNQFIIEEVRGLAARHIDISNGFPEEAVTSALSGSQPRPT